MPGHDRRRSRYLADKQQTVGFNLICFVWHARIGYSVNKHYKRLVIRSSILWWLGEVSKVPLRFVSLSLADTSRVLPVRGLTQRVLHVTQTLFRCLLQANGRKSGASIETWETCPQSNRENASSTPTVYFSRLHFA